MHSLLLASNQYDEADASTAAMNVTARPNNTAGAAVMDSLEQENQGLRLALEKAESTVATQTNELQALKLRLAALEATSMPPTGAPSSPRSIIQESSSTSMNSSTVLKQEQDLPQGEDKHHTDEEVAVTAANLDQHPDASQTISSSMDSWKHAPAVPIRGEPSPSRGDGGGDAVDSISSRKAVETRVAESNSEDTSRQAHDDEEQATTSIEEETLLDDNNTTISNGPSIEINVTVAQRRISSITLPEAVLDSKSGKSSVVSKATTTSTPSIHRASEFLTRRPTPLPSTPERSGTSMGGSVGEEDFVSCRSSPSSSRGSTIRNSSAESPARSATLASESSRSGLPPLESLEEDDGDEIDENDSSHTTDDGTKNEDRSIDDSTSTTIQSSAAAVTSKQSPILANTSEDPSTPVGSTSSSNTTPNKSRHKNPPATTTGVSNITKKAEDDKGLGPNDSSSSSSSHGKQLIRTQWQRREANGKPPLTPPPQRDSLQPPRRTASPPKLLKGPKHKPNILKLPATIASNVLVQGLPREESIQHHTSDSDISSEPNSDTQKNLFSPRNRNYSNSAFKSLEVDNRQIVDAWNERGLYTGSLDRQTHLPDGYGTCQYRDGREYDGDWEQGHWHGHGVLKKKMSVLGATTTSHQEIYEGEFVLDRREGKGTVTYSDGRVFTGRFQGDNMREGKLEFPDQSSYEGLFQEGKRNGFGLYLFSDGSGYEGQWKDDQMHGRGRMEWSDGGWYNGDWHFGIMQGVGVETLGDGTIRHQGKWHNGYPVYEALEEEP